MGAVLKEVVDPLDQALALVVVGGWQGEVVKLFDVKYVLLIHETDVKITGIIQPMTKRGLH